MVGRLETFKVNRNCSKLPTPDTTFPEIFGQLLFISPSLGCRMCSWYIMYQQLNCCQFLRFEAFEENFIAKIPMNNISSFWRISNRLFLGSCDSSKTFHSRVGLNNGKLLFTYEQRKVTINNNQYRRESTDDLTDQY